MKDCLEKRRRETRVCYVCGDIGIEDELLTCYLCNITTKHVYCMEKMLAKIPEQWKCEECLINSPLTNSRKRLVSKKPSRPVKRKYLSDLVDSKLPVEGRRSPSSIQKPSSFCPEKHDAAKPGIAFGGFHAMSSCVLKNAKGYVSDAEQTFSSKIKATDIKFSYTSRILDASMARKKQAEKIRVLLHSKGKYTDVLKPSVRSCQPKEMKASVMFRETCGSLSQHTTPIKTREQFDRKRLKGLAFNPSVLIMEEPVEYIKPEACDSSVLHIGDVKKTESALPNTLVCKPQKHFCTEVRWKGLFEVVYDDSLIFPGIKAHLSRQACDEVYDYSERMPEKILFDLKRRTDLWPNAFKSSSPAFDDIGLYFYPYEVERSKEGYFRLLKQVNELDLALQCFLDDTELLVFSSNVLHKDCQSVEFGTEMFLWGVFRTRLKQQRRRSGHFSPSRHFGN